MKLNSRDSVNFFKEGRSSVNPEASGDQIPKDHHHVLSGIIPGYGPFHHYRLI